MKVITGPEHTRPMSALGHPENPFAEPVPDAQSAHTHPAFLHINPSEHARCDCHECTQARWRMSIEGKMSGALSRPIPETLLPVPQASPELSKASETINILAEHKERVQRL